MSDPRLAGSKYFKNSVREYHDWEFQVVRTSQDFADKSYGHMRVTVENHWRILARPNEDGRKIHFYTGPGRLGHVWTYDDTGKTRGMTYACNSSSVIEDDWFEIPNKIFELVNYIVVEVESVAARPCEWGHKGGCATAPGGGAALRARGIASSTFSVSGPIRPKARQRAPHGVCRPLPSKGLKPR